MLLKKLIYIMWRATKYFNKLNFFAVFSKYLKHLQNLERLIFSSQRKQLDTFLMLL